MRFNILSEFNTQQRVAVTAPDGQVLVLAGPGTGKTRVLTHRVAWLIRERGIPPFHLLAITFTNRAARVMQERVQTLVEGSLEGIWLGTFHSQCAKLLRREENLLPFKRNFVIFDEDDQQSLVKKAIRELNLDEKLYRPAGVLAAISNAKNQLMGPKDFPARNYREEAGKKVYTLYQQKLEQNNALDFNDLLFWAVRLLADHPDLRNAYAHKFEHVLVDEFQETNTAQYELLRLLSSYHGNIFVVGDEDQSIYRWRGADYKNVLRFEKDYPDCRKILLEQNYRSTRTIVETARAVIDRNTARTHKNLFSERPEGMKITLYEATDDYAEAAYVVETIAQLISSQQANAGDLAVMYRTNAQSRLLEEAFIRSGMPYRLVGAQRFYGRREIKDVISYLRLASNPSYEVDLPRGIGALAVDWQKKAAMLPLSALFDTIIAESGYQAYLVNGSEEGDYCWENVMELRRLAFEFQELGLVSFLDNLALVGSQDTIPDQSDAPTLLTLHAAKGLEFNTVFITGLDEDLLPHSSSREDPEEMAEERRLFYVGLTRPKDRLYLVRAEQRSGNYGPIWSSPSRFLDDIPVPLVSLKGISERSGKSARKSDTFTTWTLTSDRSAAPAKQVEMKYKAGMRVKNENWGEGMVVDARIQDGEERIDVFFDSVGFKRLIASMARLEILGEGK